MIIIIECFLHIKNPVLNILYVVSDCLFSDSNHVISLPICPYALLQFTVNPLPTVSVYLPSP